MWLASRQGGNRNTFMFSVNWWPDKSRNKGLKIEIKINQGFCGNLKEILRGSLVRQNWGLYLSTFLYSTIQCTIFQYFTIFQSYNLSRSLFTIYRYSQSLQTIISYIYRIVSIYLLFSEVHTHCVYLRFPQSLSCTLQVHCTYFHWD